MAVNVKNLAQCVLWLVHKKNDEVFRTVEKKRELLDHGRR